MWRHQGIQIPEQAASKLATLESNDSQSDIIRAARKEARRKRKEIVQLKKRNKRLRTEKDNGCEISNVAKGVTQVSYLGKPNCVCEFCNAMWHGERSTNTGNITVPKFGLCCKEGKVKLPPLKQAPLYLWQLLRYN